MKCLRTTLLIFLILPVYLTPWQTKAAFPFDQDLFSDLDALLNQSAPALIKTIGFIADHRPYQGATGLGTKPGIEIFVELTLGTIPDDFKTALETAGMSASDLPPSLPIPKIHLHKGLGQKAELGLTFLGYSGYLVAGMDFKLVVLQPEEGINMAVRVGFSYAQLGIIKTRTWTPAILISKKFTGVDPYLGIAYQYVSGTLNITLEPLPSVFVSRSADASGGTFMAFLGLGFKLGPTGLKMGLEGSYSSYGAHTLGTTFGFSF